MPLPASCLPLWSLIPFVLMLVCIAVLPMAVPEWWDSNRNKTILSIAFSLPAIAVVLSCDPRLMWHSILDYFSFLTLLASVFVIAGGLYVKGEYAGTPVVNKWTKLHGEKHRGKAGHPSTVVRPVHAVFRCHPDAVIHSRDICLLSNLS